MHHAVCTVAGLFLFVAAAGAQEARTYQNRLTPIKDAKPLLADHPEFIEPIRESARFEAPILVDDKDADLDVRTWRFSYNARGIIEMPNRLKASATALIVVHPWGVDDGQGWKMPEPAGVAFACTHEKNRVVRALVFAPQGGMFIGGAPSDLLYIDRDGHATSLGDRDRPDRFIFALALGPEGGWAEDELEMFQEARWISASLGNTILRAETAAIASLAVVLAEQQV